jgi:hypothetical protein
VCEGQVCEGQVCEGQVYEGQVYEGQVCEGQVREGQVYEGAAPLVFKGAGFDLCHLLRAIRNSSAQQVSNYAAPLLRQPERLFSCDEFDGRAGDKGF